MKRLALLVALLGAAHAATPQDWATTFPGGGTAVHVTATVVGRSGQPQALEFWRDANGATVRRTGNAVELRLTPAPDGEDAYQLRDLAKRTAYDVHRVNLFRVGIFTDRWSVQHLLDTPSGAYTLTPGAEERTPVGPCRWVTITPQQGAVTEACWSAREGLPLRERVAGREVLTVTALDQAPLPAAALPDGWLNFDADTDIAPD